MVGAKVELGCGDQRLLDVVVHRRLLRRDEARSHVHAGGAERQRGSERRLFELEQGIPSEERDGRGSFGSFKRLRESGERVPYARRLVAAGPRRGAHM